MTTYTDKFGCEWYEHDTRGYIDAGPACDKCGACECDDSTHEDTEAECIGLPLAWVCLDGGDALCPECAAQEGIG
jgi:hypothetical protein